MNPEAGGTLLPETVIKAGSKHNYDLKLSVVQPIYTGNIIANSIRLEEQKAESKRFETNLRQIEVAGSIKETYWKYLLLERKKASLLLLTEKLKLHHGRIKELYDEEMARRSDLLETKIKITETELNIESIDRSMEEANIAFNRLCSYNVSNIRRNYIETIGSPAEALEFFKMNHPAMKIINRQVEMFRTKKKIISGRYLPQANGYAELHYGKPGIDFFKNEWSLYFQGGVSVSLKVFDWKQKKRDLKIAHVSIQQLLNRKHDLLAEVEKVLTQLYSYLNSTKRQLSSVATLESTALEDAELKGELYKENQASNIDYLVALINVERYKSKKEELEFQEQMIKLNINRVMGNLLKYKGDRE